MSENLNLDQKVENILIGKTKLVYAIVVVTLALGAMFFKIQLDIALIKENHEAHMEAALEKIKNLENEEQKIYDKLDTQQEAIIRLLQMHEK